MKLLIFLHGTTLMHRSAIGHTRAERVRQVRAKEASVHDYASYVPVGNAVSKLHHWSEQGAELIYLSPHQRQEDVDKDQAVLSASGFPAGAIVFRQPGEAYQGVAERVLPDILIEDDCESIGGTREMTYPYLRPEMRASITSIVVKEFAGIDHLPDALAALKKLGG